MILSHRVALGGVQLDSVDSRIVVAGVSGEAPRETVITAPRGLDGSRFVKVRRESLEVSVTVAIHQKKNDMAAREAVMEAIAGWARNVPGWLTAGQKPGRKLYVESVKLPAAGDPWNWTNNYTFTFQAVQLPWWISTTATTVEMSGTGTTTDMNTGGTADSPCDALVTNVSGATINDLTIGVGNTAFQFASLGLANGETLSVAHEMGGFLFIRILNGGTARSAMAKRTANSSNDLILRPGTNTVLFTSGGAVEVTLMSEARYA